MEREAKEFLERLFRSEHATLLIYAEAALQDYDDAEDAVQKTFEEAISAGDKLLEHPNPHAWLMKTLKYNLYDTARERQRAIHRFISLDKTGIWNVADRSASVESSVFILTMPEIMGRIKDNLSSDDYYILVQIVLKNASRSETAKALGISTGACQKRLERIRKHLRSIFPEY